MGQLSKKVGRRIKEMREQLGIKQYSLAEELNMEPSNLTRIEGGYQLPKEENLVRIADCLNVQVKDLFDFPEEYPKNDALQEIVKILENMSEDKINFIYNFIKMYNNQK